MERFQTNPIKFDMTVKPEFAQILANKGLAFSLVKEVC